MNENVEYVNRIPPKIRDLENGNFHAIYKEYINP